MEKERGENATAAFHSVSQTNTTNIIERFYNDKSQSEIVADFSIKAKCSSTQSGFLQHAQADPAAGHERRFHRDSQAKTGEKAEKVKQEQEQVNRSRWNAHS